ncbi:MAG: choice-of-anchor V domain-containing protein [Saprospiraceae bacterium]|jgi:hypothetical protein|uniref:choice-of-anchor V domain-containing protein n=1 Tax=Candidatus Brachybacter algidus TaxID=2982024 RepID=UPI001B790D7D|nr:choice-of-anchor V domain-containing protein [Candidatus Brachybacter algidus]MBP7307536.1 T9SS type A sorting domain-containing protein [Saprospiraceae bacterium]MBK6450080.1 T9SS type A sorting domain-containing protein [Candidatus Brachybacter algidus]MBK7603671.1 T9SS type A sorting domain-containing protein [Candidatus Brachybacter algidus]MBK8355884.1 T9SS type A sorting domain-containing protein [Candidatus Brachybacter algidus]MBK8601718.1 T9SS type A sorting domain-containing prote
MFKSTIGVLTIGLIAMLSMSNMGGRAKQGGEGNTGAPGDKSYNCSECHSGGAYNVSTAITLKDEEGNVVDKYKPSTLYKLSFSFTTISGSNPKGYGFQLVSIVDGANTNAGTMANPTTDAQVTSKNGRSYFEHKKPSFNSTFTVDWTSPAGGSGNVAFYGVGNANNTNSSTSGDVIKAADPLFITEQSASSGSITLSKLFLFPNPVSNELRWNAPSGRSDLNYTIYRLDGTIIEVPLSSAANGSFDVSKFSPGYYILMAKTAHGETIAKNSFIKI